MIRRVVVSGEETQHINGMKRRALEGWCPVGQALGMINDEGFLF